MLQEEEGAAEGTPVGKLVLVANGFIVQLGGMTPGGTAKVPWGTCGIGGTSGTLPKWVAGAATGIGASGAGTGGVV